MKITRSASTLLFFGTLAVSLGVPDVALSCEFGDCGPDYVDRYLPDHGSTIPANARGFFSSFLGRPPSGKTFDATLIRTDTDDGAEPISLIEGDLDSPFAYEFVSETPLEEGGRYIFDAPSSCEVFIGTSYWSDTTLTVNVGPPAALPTHLGELEVVDIKRGRLEIAGSDACVETIRTEQAHIMLHLAEEAEPWKETLWFETRVNGRAWFPTAYAGQSLDISPGASWVGRGEDLVFAKCGETPGVENGLTTIEIYGYLPGYDEPIVSDQIEVDLSCGPLGGCGSCSVTDSSGSRQSGALFLLVLVAGLLWLRRGSTA